MKRNKFLKRAIVAIIVCEIVALVAIFFLSNQKQNANEQVASEVVEEMEEISNISITKIELNQQYVLPGEEADHVISIREIEASGMDWENQIEIKTDVSTDTIVLAQIFVKNAYVINDEKDRCFLLLSTDMCSDDYILYVYRIENGVLQKTDQVSGLWVDSKSKLEIPKLTLAQLLDVLGSYYGYADYHLDDNGKICRDEEMYEIMIDENRTDAILTVSKELQVEINGNKEILPIGSKIRIVGTDNQGTALFRMAGSDVEGKIFYTKGDGENTWGILIDGIHDYEYFEFVPYAD